MPVTPDSRIKVSMAGRFSLEKFLIYGLPIFLGLGMGLLITRGEWLYALTLALLAPFVILFSARPFVGVILWLLLMPISSALPNPDIAYWAIHRTLIPLTLVMTILPRLLKKDRESSISLGPAEVAMGTLAVLVPISILLSQVNTQQSLIYYGDRILIPFFMYLVVRFTTLHERDLQLLQWTALVIVISQSIIGFLSWFAPHLLPSVWHNLIGARTVGSLIDPAVYTSMLVFCTTLLFQRAMTRKPGLLRSIFLLACGLSAICVFLSLERGSWLGGILVFLGLIVLYPKPILRLILPFSIIVFLGAGALSSQIELAGQRLSAQQPVSDRIVLNDAMLQMIQVKPILGWGYETLNQNIQQFYRTVGAASITQGFLTSHNTYLTIMTELGLVGFVLYMFPAFWWFTRTIGLWRQLPKEGLLSRSMIAVFWLAALHNFVVSNFIDMRFLPIGLTLWWISLGLVANIVYPYTKSITPAPTVYIRDQKDLV